MKVIFYNDDFGLTYGLTDAVIDCINYGLTTASCIRTNGTAYEYCLSRLTGKVKKAVTGLHFNLTDGPALNPALADSQGNFKYSFFDYVLLLLIQKKGLKHDIEKEFELQLAKLKKAGVSVDHVNSQEHVHMIPGIFQIVARLCKRHKIRKIRIVREPLYTIPQLNINIVKFIILKLFALINIRAANKYGLDFPDYFYGVIFTNNMHTKTVKEALTDANNRNAKTIEVLAHPAYTNDLRDVSFTSEEIDNYASSPGRKVELQTFLDKSGGIRTLVKKLHISLSNY